MAGYEDADDLDDDVDVPTTSGTLGRVALWVAIPCLLGLGLWQALQLQQVAYGTIPGDFTGTGVNQIGPDEAMVNEPSAYIYAKPDVESEVLFTAPAGKRFAVLGREGRFLKLPLPPNGEGYILSRAATLGYLFLDDDVARGAYDRRFFPKRFTKVINSMWEDVGRGHTRLAVEVENRSSVPLDRVDLRISFLDERGEAKDAMDLPLEGRIEAGGRRTWEELDIDLGDREFARSEMQVAEVYVATGEAPAEGGSPAPAAPAAPAPR